MNKGLCSEFEAVAGGRIASGVQGVDVPSLTALDLIGRSDLDFVVEKRSALVNLGIVVKD